MKNEALCWWHDHLGVFAGGFFIADGNPWFGIPLVAMATYVILKNTKAAE